MVSLIIINARFDGILKQPSKHKYMKTIKGQIILPKLTFDFQSCYLKFHNNTFK